MSSHRDSDPVPIVILEDDPIHLGPYYFCATDDPDCPCRVDSDLIDVVHAEYTGGLLTAEEATRIVYGQQLNSSERSRS